MKEAAYRVRGKVQGVGFRWWTRSRARGLGLAGTVRNCPDGSVEVRVRGTEQMVAAFREQLALGPPGSHVEEVEEIPTSPVDDESFEIIR
jgi:acylphosphatase